MAKVTAYRKDTGEPVHIPAHWLENKRLAEPFRKTPPTKGGTEKAPATAGTTTKKEG